MISHTTAYMITHELPKTGIQAHHYPGLLNLSYDTHICPSPAFSYGILVLAWVCQGIHPTQAPKAPAACAGPRYLYTKSWPEAFTGPGASPQEMFLAW